jgi:protein-S-isoprenylcysteine O-methyltransferase Ste14
MHFLFFAGVVAPGTVMLFYPELTHLDELVGIESLPWKPFFLVVGIMLGLPGFYFLEVSNKLLRALGSGANAFRLTRQIVATDVYQRTRNPISFGYYLGAIAMGFVFGPRLLTLAIILGLIPAHLFFLKFFEEFELELHFGKITKNIKRKSPFCSQGFLKIDSLAGAIGAGLGGWFLDACNFSLSNLILLMGALMLSFGIYWFINGVWSAKKLAVPTPIE